MRSATRCWGPLNGFVEHDELYWNAIGDQWGVPIDRVSVTVLAPSGIQRAACYTGPTGSTTPCLGVHVRGDAASFADRHVAPYEGLTVVVAIPTGAVTPPPQPILEERLTLANAFRVTPWTSVSSGVLLFILFVPLGWLLWRTGRDRRFRGSAVDAVMGGSTGEESVPLGHADDGAPVEFAPPDGLRPGQVGTLIDERANVLDVAATIVDLAVRGHLQIRELPKEGWFTKPDWQLLQLDKEEELFRYERSLLDGLFRDGSNVLLSKLRTTFAPRLADVQKALYDDAVDKGWFAASPEKVRSRWRAIGTVGAVVGVALTWLLARAHLGLVGLPILAAGLLVLVAASRMPARTAKGTAIAMRIRGFRTVIEVSETHLSKWAEQENVFTRYLPYAIVFGCTDTWAATFAALGDAPAHESLGWYVATRPIVFSDMAEALDGFTVATSGTLTSTPAGSGSSGFSGGGFGGGGFSGGGGGGGGGGSW